MTTVATAELRELAVDWKACFTSAQISGILPDPDHIAKGGYHVSRQDQRNRSNYSVVRPDDKQGPDNAAAAIDMTMNAADMRLCTSRLVKAFSDVSDPRRKYVNAFNGTLDNRKATRWDVYARTTKSATEDHLWHVHLEVRRRYVNSRTAMQAILSILRGQSWSPETIRAAVSSSSPGILMKGSKGEAVKKLQSKIGVPADGKFGAETEAALKVWQKKNKLVADGIAGRATQAAMFR